MRTILLIIKGWQSEVSTLVFNCIISMLDSGIRLRQREYLRNFVFYIRRKKVWKLLQEDQGRHTTSGNLGNETRTGLAEGRFLAGWLNPSIF